MAESVDSFVRFLQRSFDLRREEDYVNRCAIPMMVYSEDGGLALASTREQVAEMVVDAWGGLRRAAARVEIRAVAVGLPQKRGFPARIDWCLFDADRARRSARWRCATSCRAMPPDGCASR
jgi:hypothetical protein